MKRGAEMQSGFMLMEAVLAMTIFAIATVGIVSSLHAASSLVGVMNRERWVQKQQEDLLIEVLRISSSRSEFTTRKVVSFDEFGAEGTVEAIKVDVENSEGKYLTDLYEVKITIRWLENQERKESTITTHHYYPTYYAR